MHGDATLTSILQTGNGMYFKFNTEEARIEYVDDSSNDVRVVYDFGSCTITQLLFGQDDELEAAIQQIQQGGESKEQFSAQDKDDDSMSSYLFNDGFNPCLQDLQYFKYLEWRNQQYASQPTFDFIVLNDNTRSPARTEGREAGLQILEQVYIPFFQMTNATPIFLHTHAYWSHWRDLSGMIDVPTFTSYTYAGYQAYVDLVNSFLSLPHQKARIAPAGMAYLLIFEENYEMWLRLFHLDRIHASPHGTYLEGCILYATIYGKLPDPTVAIPNDMERLWSRARRMQPPTLPANPIPTADEARYLYHVCQRVMIYHQRPKSFFVTTSSANYTPEDWLYNYNSSLGR